MKISSLLTCIFAAAAIYGLGCTITEQNEADIYQAKSDETASEATNAWRFRAAERAVLRDHSELYQQTAYELKEKSSNDAKYAIAAMFATVLAGAAMAARHRKPEQPAAPAPAPTA